MSLETLFKKDVTRNINGVIKVGQQDDANVHQELSEYIIIGELDRYFNQFYNVYAESLSSPTDKIGVWISGFFGSGKSHFLKILSYLLANREARGETALSLFLPKVKDPVLEAAITRVAQAPADVILFNIDSKADTDSKGQRDAIVKVFMKVFNEQLGYLGADPAQRSSATSTLRVSIPPSKSRSKRVRACRGRKSVKRGHSTGTGSPTRCKTSLA